MPSVRVVPSEQWKVVVRGAADPRALRSVSDPAIRPLGLQGAAGGREQRIVEDEGVGEVEAGCVVVWGSLVSSSGRAGAFGEVPGYQR